MISRIEKLQYQLYRSFLKKENYVFFIILFFCFFLRIHNFSSVSIWVDEGFTLDLAHKTFSQNISLSVHDVNPPLYGIMTHLWGILFGYSLSSIRFFSVFCSLLTAMVLYKTGRKFFNYLSAILSVLFFSLSNIQIYFAEEARCYALVSLLTAVSIYYLSNFLKSKSSSYLFLLSLINILILYTHPIGGFLFVGEAVTVLIVFYKKIKLLLKYILSQLIVVAAFFPWYYAAFIAPGRDSGNNWLPMISNDLVYAFFLNVFNSKPVIIILTCFICMSLVLVIYFLIKNKRKATKYFTILILSALPLAIICFLSKHFIKLFYERYELFCTVPMFLFFGFILSSNKLNLFFKSVFIFLYLGFSFLSLNVDMHKTEDWRQACVAGDVFKTEEASTIIYPAYAIYCYDYYSLKWAYFNAYEGLDFYESAYNIFRIERITDMPKIEGRLKKRVILYSTHFWVNDDKVVENFLSKSYDQVVFKEYPGIRVYVYERK